MYTIFISKFKNLNTGLKKIQSYYLKKFSKIEKITFFYKLLNVIIFKKAGDLFPKQCSHSSRSFPISPKIKK